jgi:hypothetical protein
MKERAALSIGEGLTEHFAKTRPGSLGHYGFGHVDEAEASQL